LIVTHSKSGQTTSNKQDKKRKHHTPEIVAISFDDFTPVADAASRSSIPDKKQVD